MNRASWDVHPGLTSEYRSKELLDVADPSPLNIPDLVGGFKHGWIIFHFIKKGCHPNPIDELIFFKMVIAPPTSDKSKHL